MSTNPVPPSSPLLLPQGDVVEPVPDLVEQFELPATRTAILRMQKFFVEYINNGFDPSAAAIACGYSVKYASGQAMRLLKTAYVQRLMHEHLAEIQERAEITGEEVVRELAKIGRANMADYISLDDQGQPCYNFTNLTRDDWAAVTELHIEEVTVGTATQRKVKFKLGPKAQALHDLGEYFKLFTRKNELTGPNGTPLVPPTVTVKFSKKGAVNVSASGDVHRVSGGCDQAEGPEAVVGRDSRAEGSDSDSPTTSAQEQPA